MSSTEMGTIKAVLHGQIMNMVKDGSMSAEKHVSISNLRKRINAQFGSSLSVEDVLIGSRDAGYLIYRLASGSVICLEKSIEQIEHLKTNWAKDPIWDIEETDGFEAYAEELRAWRGERSTRIDAVHKERDEKRAVLVREQTGVLDVDIASSLHTWNEIELDVENAETHETYLQAAQVRATLLQAAQLKRIADALASLVDLAEVSDSRDSLAESVRIWSGK